MSCFLCCSTFVYAHLLYIIIVMSAVKLIYSVAAASVKDKSSDNGEWRTSDERLSPRAKKCSSLPVDCSHCRNNAASMCSPGSELCSPVAPQTSRSLSAVNLEVDSSQNSSAGASDSTEQHGSSMLMFHQGCYCVNYDGD